MYHFVGLRDGGEYESVVAVRLPGNEMPNGLRQGRDYWLGIRFAVAGVEWWRTLKGGHPEAGPHTYPCPGGGLRMN
jgi:hypothetical protein